MLGGGWRDWLMPVRLCHLLFPSISQRRPVLGLAKA